MSRSSIDSYLADLKHDLRGPRRLKAEFLQEARDSLDDAVEALREEGHDDREAESLALADFGTLAEVSPAYQRELALAQARRTAWWFALVMALQLFQAKQSWRDTGAWSDSEPHPLYLVFIQVWGYGQILFVGLAGVTIFIFGLGTRYVDAPWRFARLTGLATLIMLVLKAGVSVVLLLTTPYLAASILSELSPSAPGSLLATADLVRPNRSVLYP
ncbi:hypothetical protein HII36_36755 [Nonomuraea sp. NN258]|uniref:permease prefix domain 1-containing protein n=1 Tax=Nonomuraea antri TaxID=2730852 RepID=UPI00156A335B|nr:permease prefix domain 1-containing protein [Nonomuraea antri]NRQ37347.1 hypothetical protein [Nonomuraea antri]